jgi:hypothetical protein
MKANAQVAAIFISHFETTAREIVRAKNDQKVIKANKRRLTPLLSMLALGEEESGIVRLSNGYDNIPCVQVSMWSAESFKCDAVVARLWALEEFAPIVEQTVKEYPASLNRDFTFDYGHTRATFAVYVKHSSPTCRKVVIGQKTETVDEFKIVCD